MAMALSKNFQLAMADCRPSHRPLTTGTTTRSHDAPSRRHASRRPAVVIRPCDFCGSSHGLATVRMS